MIGEFPTIGVMRPDLVPDRFRFLVLPGTGHVLVYELSPASPARIVSVVDGRRDLDVILSGLDDA